MVLHTANSKKTISIQFVSNIFFLGKLQYLQWGYFASITHDQWGFNADLSIWQTCKQITKSAIIVMCFTISSYVFKFLRQSLMIFIIKGFWTIDFIFIVISTMFWPICPPAFFRCLLNPGTFTELRPTSFIESTGIACSDSVSYNRVQVLSIPVLLLTCSQDWTCNLHMIISLDT